MRRLAIENSDGDPVMRVRPSSHCEDRDSHILVLDRGNEFTLNIVLD